MAERIEVVVVGGGQAGLAASYELMQSKVPHLILDAELRTGDSWRRRWDSLELFSDARYSALPGLAFPGDPEHFPTKDLVANYLESYARAFHLPIRSGTRARALEPANGGYRIETDSEVFDSANVIVATGAYQVPAVPKFAERLSQDVVQLHSVAYRNPAQIASYQVLVVGTANSGVQIAADLAASHRVSLSRGQRLPYLPRRVLGRGVHWWGDHLGLIAAPLDSWRGRTQRGDLLIGTSVRQLVRGHGVKLVGRTVDAADRTVKLADGVVLDVETIVWATGYRSDYSWIRAPVFDANGALIHRRGVTNATGLYFLGMHNQYSRGSSLIGFVGNDARFITDQVCGRVGAANQPR